MADEVPTDKVQDQPVWLVQRRRLANREGDRKPIEDQLQAALNQLEDDGYRPTQVQFFGDRDATIIARKKDPD